MEEIKNLCEILTGKASRKKSLCRHRST